MSRNMAYGVTIKSIDNIEGKDRIGYIHFNENGYGVIGQKTLNVGDKVVYVEVDSILPIEEKFEFLRKRCYKESINGFLIKAMKMNGLYSNGIIFTKEDLGLDDIKIGKDYTSILNIRKYELEDDASPNDKKENKVRKAIRQFMMKHSCLRWLGKKLFYKVGQKGEFPTEFISKSDEDNIQNNPAWFDKYKNDDCYITYKIEGQSVTLIYNFKKKKFEIYGRNSLGREEHYEYFKTLDIEKKMKSFCKQYNINVLAIQGEYCSSKVQSGVMQNGTHFYVFKITQDSVQQNMTTMKSYCELLGLDTVPFIPVDFKVPFKFGLWFNDINDMQELSEHLWYKIGTYPLEFYDDRITKEDNQSSRMISCIPCGIPFEKKSDIPEKKNSVYHRNEGLVFRAFDQSWSFKVKSNNYQIEGL